MALPAAWNNSQQTKGDQEGIWWWRHQATLTDSGGEEHNDNNGEPTSTNGAITDGGARAGGWGGDKDEVGVEEIMTMFLGRRGGWGGGWGIMGAPKNYSTNHNLPSAKMHPNLHTMVGNDKRTVVAADSSGVQWQATAGGQRWQRRRKEQGTIVFLMTCTLS